MSSPPCSQSGSCSRPRAHAVRAHVSGRSRSARRRGPRRAPRRTGARARAHLSSASRRLRSPFMRCTSAGESSCVESVCRSASTSASTAPSSASTAAASCVRSCTLVVSCSSCWVICETSLRNLPRSAHGVARGGECLAGRRWRVSPRARRSAGRCTRRAATARRRRGGGCSARSAQLGSGRARTRVQVLALPRRRLERRGLATQRGELRLQLRIRIGELLHLRLDLRARNTARPAGRQIRPAAPPRAYARARAGLAHPHQRRAPRQPTRPNTGTAHVGDARRASPACRARRACRAPARAPARCERQTPSTAPRRGPGSRRRRRGTCGTPW